MKHNEDESPDKRGDEWCGPRHGTAGERANHDDENGVKRGRLSEKAFLSQAHQKNEHEVDDDSPQPDLGNRELVRGWRRKPQCIIDEAADLLHVAEKTVVSRRKKNQ